jgi:hypothetical protein
MRGIAKKVAEFLRKKQVQLELIAVRLLAADTVRGIELDDLLQEEHRR